MKLPRALYSDDALRIAAEVFDGRATIRVDSTRTVKVVPASLEKAFANEALNQEYRLMVGRFYAGLADVLVTRALLAARGGDAPPPAPAEPPGFAKQAEALLKAATEEFSRAPSR